MSNARFGLRVRNGLVRPITEGLQVIDVDAAAFISAANITNPIQYSAIVQLVSDLKIYGLWTKLKAIYPWVGGTDAAHKFNLKDPRDLDAAFRLVFNGGWIHNNTGGTPNGINGFADTFLVPNVVLSQNSISMGVYSGTNGVNNGGAIGSSNLSSYFRIFPNFPSFGLIVTMNDASLNSIVSNTDGSGFLFAYRTLSTQKKVSRRGTIFTLNENTNGINAFKIYIGATNESGTASNYSNFQHRFTFIGDGLTDTEAANLHTTVQNFQTTLGRQV